MTFEDEWSRCAPWIEAALALSNGTHDLDDVKAEVMRGDARFWAGRKSAMVTTEQEYPKLKAFCFWLAGGDLEELRDELGPMAEAYYRDRGCRFATLNGRQGWTRALKPSGYQTVHWTCAKELTCPSA